MRFLAKKVPARPRARGGYRGLLHGPLHCRNSSERVFLLVTLISPRFRTIAWIAAVLRALAQLRMARVFCPRRSEEVVLSRVSPRSTVHIDDCLYSSGEKCGLLSPAPFSPAFPPPRSPSLFNAVLDILGELSIKCIYRNCLLVARRRRSQKIDMAAIRRKNARRVQRIASPIRVPQIVRASCEFHTILTERFEYLRVVHILQIVTNNRDIIFRLYRFLSFLFPFLSFDHASDERSRARLELDSNLQYETYCNCNAYIVSVRSRTTFSLFFFSL